MLRLLLGLLFLGALLAGKAIAQTRTWTTSDGRRAQGELFEVVGDEIGLRIRGREYRFPITRFSSEDQAYVREWLRSPRCELCARPLGKNKTMKAGDKSYHAGCFRCLVCRNVFKPGESFRRDKWGMLVHVNHYAQAASCGSCSKIFARQGARREQFLPDGRVVCLSCLGDGVYQDQALREVDARVTGALRSVGIDKPEGKITLELVDRSALLKEGKRIRVTGENLKGLTLTKFRTTTKGSVSNTTFEHRIMVLYGLPYVECQAVLAHEYLHVWLNERFVDASPAEVEGFCNLGSHLLLQKESGKLSSVLMQNMKESTSPIYGVGYRRMVQLLARRGWPGLLADMAAKAKRK